MLVFLTIFLAALALAWVVGFLAAAKIDVQSTSVPEWTPAFFIASHFVSGLHSRVSLFFVFAGLLCVGLGILLHNVVSVVFFAGALGVFAPLAFYLCYKIRENALMGKGEHVFFNIVRPPALDEERDLALYIDDDEWASIPAATPHYLKFWQEYHVTDGLYICPCENHVLQAIDSLNLYKYIINPDHPKMLNAFANALNAVNPSNVSQSAYARRTFVRLQTQAQGALSVQKKPKEEGEKRKPKPTPELPPEIMKMFKHLEEKEKESHDLDDDDDDEDLDDWEKEFLKELEAEHEKKTQKKPTDESQNNPED